MEKEYLEIIRKMTLKEKATLCVGDEYWSNDGVERFGIPEIRMSDGPHGLRYQIKADDNLGLNDSEISTCFPALSTVSNTWDKDLVYKLGETLGEEAIQKGVNVLLGPSINIKRSPLCGRNFEYFSEDPYLTGILGTEYVKGLQSKNVGACVKHFAANSQEYKRRTINSVVDERTLREIYLKAFEMIIKNAKPWTIMSAYNKVNEEYCSENEHLLVDILRGEWNFEGIVISDWMAENDRVSGIKAGHELEMPAGYGTGVQEIIDAVNSGEIPESLLDECAYRVLKVALKGKDNKPVEYDAEKHHEIAGKIAEEAIVLLKNEDKILPLKSKKIAIIGDLADKPRYQGAGSSRINAYKVENTLDNFKENNIEFEYAKGYERTVSLNDEFLRNEAVSLAKKTEVVLIYAGLTENYETEGIDRKTLDLPENQNKLIEEVCKVNSNVVVVLTNGSPITMAWKDKVKGIITGYLGGEAGAKAMVNCLIGKVNPSGKLSETYPIKLEDTPCYNYFPGEDLNAEYKESIYVGYRYYDKVKKDVLFPFGYGLSYTSFKYSNLNITQKGNSLNVSFKIKNVGDRKGKEIAEVYISQKNPVIFKPVKELKGFEKVELEPGEEKEVNIKLTRDAFKYYNVETKKWSVEEGKYYILVGKSSRDIVLSEEIKMKSDDKNIGKKYSEKYILGDIQNVTDSEFEELLRHKIPNRHFKLEEADECNTIEQLKETLVGKAIYDNQSQKADVMFEEQRVNEAAEVLMALQQPLKKIYQDHRNNITKEMVEEFLQMAKDGEPPEKCRFVEEFIKFQNRGE